MVDVAVTTNIEFNKKGTVGGYPDIALIDAQSEGSSKFYVRADGKVGIGKTDPAFKLDVCSIIRSTEWIVEDIIGCDFVFNRNYPLMALKERKRIVLQNKHLLYVKPAREMQEQGAEMGKTVMGLVRNVEEHELYFYEQDERNDKQDERDDMLEKRMEELEKRDKEKEEIIKKQDEEIKKLKELLIKRK